MKTRFAGAMAMIAALGLLGGSSAEERSRPTFRQAIDAVIHTDPYRHAHWGIRIADQETGEILFDLNGDKLFIPASTTKLFTVATALDAFGPDYRFKTPVYRRGKLDGSGRLDGDLILVASGDLTMGGRTTADGQIAFQDSDHIYANGNDKAKLTEPDPLAGLNQLAQQVKASGIRYVAGDVLIDDRLFARASSTGSGPRRVSPIIINDNVIDLVITPSDAGQPAQVTWRPRTAYVQVDAVVRTVAKDKPIRLQMWTTDGRRFSVRGEIPAGHKPLVRIFEVGDPAAFARALFIEALRRAGIGVDASPLFVRGKPVLPPRSAYAEMDRVATLVSPPFSENARLILKVSHNLHASTLPLLVAAKHGKRTLAEGLRLQHQFLKRVGVDVDSISFGGGAGGDRADCITPRATIQLLRYMATRPDFDVYFNSLPILGVDGTLAEVVPTDSPARGKVHAKTGTFYWYNAMNDRFLLNSKALAGYLTAASGRKLVFAFFVNQAHLEKATDTKKAGETLGKLCEIVHEHF